MNNDKIVESFFSGWDEESTNMYYVPDNVQQSTYASESDNGILNCIINVCEID